MKTSLSLAAVALALAACNSPADKPAPAADATAAVTAADAWCRPSPNGAKAGGCYVTLTAATDDRLTGGSTPRESMPLFVQYLMLSAPTTHFISASQAILFRAAGFAVVWPAFLALALIGAVFFTVSLARFRKMLSQLA